MIGVVVHLHLVVKHVVMIFTKMAEIMLRIITLKTVFGRSRGTDLALLLMHKLKDLISVNLRINK